ncbi:TIGR03619 family F420-dependent LLM class oxidoreductase [bacterium]|nr:TIGR03619 family F420-dependent LLM class oxidoreductase [bacterium]
MRFGLGVPTATEGMMYPVPYADAAEAVHLAVEAERLGFESIWGNDHVSTQQYVREEFADPPRFWDPFTYLAFVAARTERIRLATAVTVMSFRHPAHVAKQAATLDHLSGGRMVLGVGIGAYREEFEALYPGVGMHRGDHAGEFLKSLAILFGERRGSFSGKYVSFDDLESNPKPLQDPLPILSGGNSPGSRHRAAGVGGWLPACLTTAEYREGLDEITEIAGGSLVDRFEPALQVAVAIGDSRGEAIDRFMSSQVHTHLTSLSESTMKGRLDDDLAARNLIGTADEVCERVAAYADSGVGTLAGLLFAADTVDETLDQMTAFSEGVISRFGEDA